MQVEYAQDWLATTAEHDGNRQAQWRTDPARAGPSGALGDIATHAFHLASFVTGLTPTELLADLARFGEGRTLDDNAHVLLRYPSGAREGRMPETTRSAETATRLNPARLQGPKSEKKRRAIVRAATMVINTKSYALATMVEIAAAMNLRDGSLYCYFTSKQALGFACHCQSLETFERLLAAADATGGNGAERLTTFLRGMLDDAEHNGPQLYLGDYTYLEVAHREIVAAWVARLTGQLEQFLIAGVRDGSIAPCETRLVVQLLLGMLIWLAKWVPSIEDISVNRLMTAIEAFGLRGLRGDPA